MRLRLLAAMSALLVGTAASAQDLRFGYPGTPAGALAIVAGQLGLWKKHDVDVVAIQQAAAINVRDALVSGSIDVGFAGLSNVIVGVASGAPLVVIGTAVDQCAATAIVVRKDSPYQALADLKGKRLGSEIATVTHGSLVSGVLPKNKLGPRDLQIVNVRFGDMVSALLSGSVDAITAVEPFLSQAEQAGTIRAGVRAQVTTSPRKLSARANPAIRAWAGRATTAQAAMTACEVRAPRRRPS